MRLHPQHARRWAALGGVVALLAAVPAGTACELSECNPMKDRAAESMIAAWCDRYVACDASRGKVEDCRAERLAALPAQDDSGCAADCANDDACSARSTCRSSKIDECVTKTRAMACADQIDGPLVKYPDFCDTCFR